MTLHLLHFSSVPMPVFSCAWYVGVLVCPCTCNGFNLGCSCVESVCLYTCKRTTHKVNPAQLGRTNKMCVFLTVGAGTGLINSCLSGQSY